MIRLNLSKENFSINDISLSFPIEIELLNKLLSINKRATKTKHNTIFTWDDLGILAYSKNGKVVESLLLELKEEDFAFSPKQVFKGQFYFDNEEITRYICEKIALGEAGFLTDKTKDRFRSLYRMISERIRQHQDFVSKNDKDEVPKAKV